MKILVATSDVPFVEGGHRVIARSLVQALQEAGHSAEIFTTPQNRFGRQFSAYLATWLTDVGVTGSGEPLDRIISIRFPSYALRHPEHVCWLNHRMREYYDLWSQWTSTLSWKGKIKELVRRGLINKADTYFLKHNVKKVFAQSENIRRGLLRWGNIPSEVLYPPPPQREYHTEGYGDFVFSPSRLAPLKRVPLLIESLAKSKVGKAVIAGEGGDAAKIISFIKQNSLENRIELLGHVGEQQLLDLYARCRAVYYAPYNEDFGLVTLEAFASKKPVLTTSDSGGPTELVVHRKNGLIAEPNAESIANQINALFETDTLAEKMGEAGFEKSRSINWPDTISRLLS